MLNRYPEFCKTTRTFSAQKMRLFRCSLPDNVYYQVYVYRVKCRQMILFHQKTRFLPCANTATRLAAGLVHEAGPGPGHRIATLHARAVYSERTARRETRWIGRSALAAGRLHPERAPKRRSALQVDPHKGPRKRSSPRHPGQISRTAFNRHSARL